MNKIPAILVIEDDLSLNVVKRLITSIESNYFIEKTIPEVRRKNSNRGNSYIQNNIAAFNKAAQHKNFIILTDLDMKDCAPSYIAEIFQGDIHKNLLLQIAVREVEAWLIADKINFSAYLGVSKDLFKCNPESILDPKQYIFSLAKKSKKRHIKQGIIPRVTTAKIGESYNELLIKFVNEKWDFNKAKTGSISLERFITKLSKIP